MILETADIANKGRKILIPLEFSYSDKDNETAPSVVLWPSIVFSCATTLSLIHI